MNFITTALAYYNVVHVVWNIYLREISTEEMNDLHWLLDNAYQESGYRAKMISLRDEGYTQYLRYEELQTIMIITLGNGYTDSMKKVLMVLYLENMYVMLTRLHKI